MKVIALNSSPRGSGQSKTELMLKSLVKGMADAGAQVDIIDLRSKKVKNCIGCFTCWTRTPGACAHRDDMSEELYPKFIELDLAVLATPLYHFTMNASMKAFMERTLPAIEPYIVNHKGKASHPLRGRHPLMAVLSVAGFPEEAVFGQLSSHLRYIYGEALVGEIYRPAAETMILPLFAEILRDILEATEEAGRELVRQFRISPETMKRITQPVGDLDTIACLANPFWKTCIDEGVNPLEFEKRGLIPRPDSIKSFTVLMKAGFNSAAAGDMNATMQFSFSGEPAGDCHFVISGGALNAMEGPAARPDMTVRSPFGLWMDIVTRKADGQAMFMEGKYTVEGDLNLLMKMGSIFGG